MSKWSRWLQAALMTMGQVLIAQMIRFSNKPEQCLMRRCTRWINSIAAAIHIISIAWLDDGLVCDVGLQYRMVGILMLWLLTKQERRRMKRLTEWINLIAAVMRLISVIFRTGWL